MKRILACLDGNGYTQAVIRHAIELARIHDARLRAVTVVDTRQLLAAATTREGAQYAVNEVERIKQASLHLESATVEFESACLRAAIPYDIKMETGDPLEILAEQSAVHDLNLFGLRSLFRQHLLGRPHQDRPCDTLAQLSAAGIRPILAVARDGRPIERVLLSYNGSPDSGRAIRRFLEQRLWPDRVYRLVAFHRSEEKARQLMEEMAAYCHDHGIEPELGYIVDSTRRRLLEYAQKWEADLMVLGNNAQRILFRKVTGEATMHVIRNAHFSLYLA